MMGKKWCDHLNSCPYFETSAKDSIQVDEAFKVAVSLALKRVPDEPKLMYVSIFFVCQLIGVSICLMTHFILSFSFLHRSDFFQAGKHTLPPKRKGWCCWVSKMTGNYSAKCVSNTTVFYTLRFSWICSFNNLFRHQYEFFPFVLDVDDIEWYWFGMLSIIDIMLFWGVILKINEG